MSTAHGWTDSNRIFITVSICTYICMTCILKCLNFNIDVCCLCFADPYPKVFYLPGVQIKGGECVRIGWATFICLILCTEPATGARRQPAKKRRIYSCTRMRNSLATHAHAHQRRAQFKVRVHSRVTRFVSALRAKATPAWPKSRTLTPDESRVPGSIKRPVFPSRRQSARTRLSGNIPLNYSCALVWTVCLLCCA